MKTRQRKLRFLPLPNFVNIYLQMKKKNNIFQVKQENESNKRWDRPDGGHIQEALRSSRTLSYLYAFANFFLIISKIFIQLYKKKIIIWMVSFCNRHHGDSFFKHGFLSLTSKRDRRILHIVGPQACRRLFNTVPQDPWLVSESPNPSHDQSRPNVWILLPSTELSAPAGPRGLA